MNQCFSLPVVLRQIPKSLLKRFFCKLGLRRMPIKWERLKPWNIRPILKVISRANEKTRMKIEKSLHQIVTFASTSGLTALHEAGGNVQPSQSPTMCFRVAMRSWIEQPEVFQRAALLQGTQHLPPWHCRNGLPCVVPQMAESVLRRLGKTMADRLHEDRLSSNDCSVEHLTGTDETEWFGVLSDMCLPRAATLHSLGYNHQTHQPPWEITFAYDHKHGMLESCSNLPPQVRLQMENAFCNIILGCKTTSKSQVAAYDLNVLKNGPKSLATEADDGVVVGIRRMRLAALNSKRSLLLVADNNGSRDDIYAMLFDCLNRQSMPMSMLKIAAVEFSITFPTIDSPKGTIIFSVTCPDLSTLRNQRPDLAAIARRYLRNWRIVVA